MNLARLIAPLLLVLPLAQLQAAKAPQVLDSQIVRPLPLPYDEQADAEAQIKVAMKKAKAAHKLLLLDLGGNWCLDCRVLAGTMEIPALKAFIEKHYVEQTVDIGRHIDKNQQIPARYGIAKVRGVPALLIIDPRTNKLINADNISALEDARSMTAQALADWLAQWTS